MKLCDFNFYQIIPQIFFFCQISWPLITWKSNINNNNGKLIIIQEKDNTSERNTIFTIVFIIKHCLYFFLNFGVLDYFFLIAIFKIQSDIVQKNS